MDAIDLEVQWSSLISTVNEQAKALQRAAFSPIVREAGDLANGLFDRRARMVAQAVTGTPGHINSLAMAAGVILEEYPVASLKPGDVLITTVPRPAAMVDSRGYAIAEFPVRILRIPAAETE